MRRCIVTATDRARGEEPRLQEKAVQVVHLMQESFVFAPVALCGAEGGELARSERGTNCPRCRKLAGERIADHIAPMVASLG